MSRGRHKVQACLKYHPGSASCEIHLRCQLHPTTKYLKTMCLTGLPATIHIPTIQVSVYTQNHNSTSRLHIHPSFPWVAKIIRAISINLWRMTSSLAQMARFQNRSCIWIKLRKSPVSSNLHVSRFFFGYILIFLWSNKKIVSKGPVVGPKASRRSFVLVRTSHHGIVGCFARSYQESQKQMTTKT